MYKYIKRLIDIVGSVIMLTASLPILVTVGLAIKLDSKGPIIFKQKRSGLNTKEFTLYKFRSMPISDDIQNTNQENKYTKIGKIIRIMSIDELPQLFNILKGDMSFIGPRPWMTDYAKLFTEKQKRRLDVRPGLTGLAQINGRNSITIEEKINYDIKYVQNLSFSLDWKIICSTPRVVFNKNIIEITKNQINEDLVYLKNNYDKELTTKKSKEKPKVLFLIHTLGAGGAEKVLVDTVNAMTNKLDITLMTIIDIGAFKSNLNPNVNYKTMFKTKNTNENLLNNKKTNFKSILIEVYKLIWKIIPISLLRKIKINDFYDIEVAFLEGITAKVVAKSSSKKMVWIHVDMINQTTSDKVFINKKSMQKTYNKFDKIVAVSEDVKEKFSKKFDNQIDPNKVTVHYNLLDSKNINLKANENIKCYDNCVVNIVSVGRLVDQKGYDRLINVLYKLKQENYKFRVSIIGVGPLYESLNKKINNLFMNEEIKLLGFKSNPFPYIKQADFFVCSSFAEGFSTAVCEASILKTPTITTDCSGMKELFGENKYGYIVPNNEKDLYKGIKYFLDNENVVANYRKNLSELQQRFDTSNSIRNIEKLILNTLYNSDENSINNLENYDKEKVKGDTNFANKNQEIADIVLNLDISLNNKKVYFEFYGLYNYPKINKKDLAAKYNYSEEYITLVCKTINEKVKCILQDAKNIPAKHITKNLKR